MLFFLYTAVFSVKMEEYFESQKDNVSIFIAKFYALCMKKKKNASQTSTHVTIIVAFSAENVFCKTLLSSSVM